MSEPHIIALTGSIGSGKSTVATFFEEWGATLVDADAIAREVVAPGSPGLAEITNIFGTGFIKPDGTLDRKALGARVFSDQKERDKLEAILHPRIKARTQELFREATKKGAKMIVHVVPLLFEKGLDLSRYHAIVSIYAPDSLLIQRILARDGCTEKEALARLASQLPSAEKVKRSTHSICNDGNKEQLKARSKLVFDLIGRN